MRGYLCHLLEVKLRTSTVIPQCMQEIGSWTPFKYQNPGIAQVLYIKRYYCSLFHHSIVSNSLRPHGVQHARAPSPSLSPRVLAQTHVYWVNDAIQPSHPLLSPSPPAFNPSQHWGFSSESALHIRWPNYLSFSFSISPSNEYSGYFSFRIDWFDLLAVPGTLKSLLQHHNLESSIPQHSAFFWQSCK